MSPTALSKEVTGAVRRENTADEHDGRHPVRLRLVIRCHMPTACSTRPDCWSTSAEPDNRPPLADRLRTVSAQRTAPSPARTPLLLPRRVTTLQPQLLDSDPES